MPVIAARQPVVVEEDVGLLADRIPTRLERGRLAGPAAVAGVRPERGRVAAAALAVPFLRGAVHERAARVAAVVAREQSSPERVVEVRPDVRDLEVLERQRC